MLEILKHCGPVRLGKFMHKDDGIRINVPTPNFFSLVGDGQVLEHELYLAPHNSDINRENVIVDYGSLYEEKSISRFGILPDARIGLKVPKEMAEDSVKKTLELAKDYPEHGAVIQGSKYLDLREKCAKALKDHPLLAVADSMELLENPRMLVEVVTRIREAISPNTALYVPFAPPHMFFLLAYMGVDLFDTGDAILNARNGMISTLRGSLRLDKIDELPCTCNICIDKKPEDLRGDYTAILNHNLNVTLAAIKEIRVAIKNNGYRELVEEKATVSPKAMATLRLLDKVKQEYLERYTPLAP